MAKLSRAALTTKINNWITTNGIKSNTGAHANEILRDIVDSFPNLLDDNGIIGLRDYDPSDTYAEGDTAVYEGELYRAVGETTGAFAGFPTWVKLPNYRDRFGYDAYDNEEEYSLNDIVIWNYLLFKSLQNNNQGNLPTDTDFWQYLPSGSGVFGEQWAAGRYLEGDVVRKNNELWYLFEGDDTLDPEEALDSSNFDAEVLSGKWRRFNDHLREIRTATSDATPQTFVTLPSMANGDSLHLRFEMRGVAQDGANPPGMDRGVYIFEGTYIKSEGVITAIVTNGSDAYNNVNATGAVIVSNDHIEIKGTGKASTTVEWTVRYSYHIMKGA